MQIKHATVAVDPTGTPQIGKPEWNADHTVTGLVASDVAGLAPVATDGSYASLTGKPTYASVATTGAYADLTGKPTIFSGAYADLTGKPTLFSGAYVDLTGKPTLGSLAALSYPGGTSSFLRADGTFATPAGSGDVVGPASSVTARIATFNGTTGKILQDGGATIAQLATVASLATVATSGAYNDLTGKPTLGTVAALSYPGGTTSFLRADGTFAAPAGGGTGDVVGPASAVSGRVVTFNGTTGKLIQDSGLTLSGTNTGDQTTITGNAGSATVLQTARTIDGVSFNGSANITVIAPAIFAATAKTTPVDADTVGITDSAASNVLKKVTWANVKATLKTYFDTLYAVLASPAFTGTPTAPTAAAGTNTTQLATTAFVTAAIAVPPALTWNPQTASYTLVLADAGKGVEMLVASANNLTVPLNSSVAFPVGTSILVYQAGAGLTTIVATGGVTIVKRGSSLAMGGQYALATLVKRATDTWILSGDIAA